MLEAGIRSGSLNTAGHAAALGRSLGAVPGPVTSPASAGCHRLLREFDAVCVVDADQMAELAVSGGPRTSGGRIERSADAGGGHGGAGDRPDRVTDRDAQAADPRDVRVLDALSTRSRRPLDDVARRAGLTVTETMSVLGRLEAESAAERDARGWRRRRAE